MSDDMNPKKEIPIEIKNEDGETVEIHQEGNVLQVTVQDPESRQLLQNILLEVKKMNFYLSQIADIELDIDELID